MEHAELARRGRTLSEHLRRLRGPALAALLVGAAACGDSGSDEAQPEPEARTAPAPAPEPMADIRPPEFLGADAVELLGLEYFRVTWTAATDDETPAEEIRYNVYHVVEPYLELSDDAQPIFATEPGATEAVFANDAPPGRFYVRAVDAAGNLSEITTGLLQRPSRPIHRLPGGALAARITRCAATPGGGLCAGQEGLTGWWTDDGWETHDLGLVSEMRIADTPAGLFLYSDVGHLFRFDDDGTPRHVDVSFPRSAPSLPFRQFTADQLGLRYWVDAEGKVFIGAEREFVIMARPLALPGEACRRLRGLWFGAHANFALCNDGSAHSANPQQAGARWLSLTPNADFSIAEGVISILADNDTGGLIVDPTGIREIGVGGWSPELLVDWHQPGIHPMDVPDDPPEIRRVNAAFRRGDSLFAATDIGLLQRDDGEWERVEGTDGPLAGVVGEARDVLVYEDGSVATLSRGRRRWLEPPQMIGFTAGTTTSAGDAIARREGDESGMYRWRDGWRRWADLPPADAAITGYAGSVDGRLFAFGSRGDVGAIWALDDDEWLRTTPLFEPPPEPEREDDDEDDDEDSEAIAGFDFGDEPPPTPPPAMRGVPGDELEDAGLSAPTMSPIVHLDLASDGRAIAVAANQVWWRLEDGWRLLQSTDDTLVAGFVDAGETYVLVGSEGIRRCWRDQCGGTVQQVDGGPAEAFSTFASTNGWELASADGSAWAFEPGPTPDPGLIDPASDTAAGRWVQRAALGDADSLVQRLDLDGRLVRLDADGGVSTEQGGRWVLQAEVPDALALYATRDDWALLTERGLITLGDVRPARRPTEPTQPE